MVRTATQGSGSTAEYDAFGPWVDPVRTVDELPWLYRDQGIDPADERLVLKVPRDVQRRDATPDMDLYDHLLVAGDRTFTVLSRDGAAVVRHEVSYGEIAAVRTQVNLLDGRLQVLTRDGADLQVRFSGSSADAVQQLVDLLRQAAWPAPAGSGTSEAAEPLLDRHALGDRELGLMTVYRDALRGSPRVRTLAAEPRRVVLPAAGGPTRLLHLLRPMTLHALVVCADATELQVLGRAHPLVRGRTPDHSWSRLVLPLAGVTEVRAIADPRYVGVTTVTVLLGHAQVHLPVLSGSTAAGVLAGLGRTLGTGSAG
jgi:hypothetical protein